MRSVSGPRSRLAFRNGFILSKHSSATASPFRSITVRMTVKILKASSGYICWRVRASRPISSYSFMTSACGRMPSTSLMRYNISEDNSYSVSLSVISFRSRSRISVSMEIFCLSSIPISTRTFNVRAACRRSECQLNAGAYIPSTSSPAISCELYLTVEERKAELNTMFEFSKVSTPLSFKTPSSRAPANLQ